MRNVMNALGMAALIVASPQGQKGIENAEQKID